MMARERTKKSHQNNNPICWRLIHHWTCPSFKLVNVAKRTSFESKWLGLLPIAHALTIFIAFHLVRNAESWYPERKCNPKDYLNEAWVVQFGSMKSGYSKVDVEWECLERLEEQMFEWSLRAGIAGYYQWGLDAGDHQECWYPYAGLSEHWNHEDLKNDEGELKVSTQRQFSNSKTMIQILTKSFVDSVDQSLSQLNSLEAQLIDLRPCPKPRPKTKRNN